MAFTFRLTLIGIRVNRTNVGFELMQLFTSHISFPSTLSHLWIFPLNQNTHWSVYGILLEYVYCSCIVVVGEARQCNGWRAALLNVEPGLLPERVETLGSVSVNHSPTTPRCKIGTK